MLIVRFVTQIRARGYAYKSEEEQICKVSSIHDQDLYEGYGETVLPEALNALVFLYKQVLAIPLGQLENLARSKRKKTLPVVLTRQQVRRLLVELNRWQLHVVSLLHE